MWACNKRERAREGMEKETEQNAICVCVFVRKARQQKRYARLVVSHKQRDIKYDN